MKTSTKDYGGFTVTKTFIDENQDFSIYYTLMRSRDRDFVKDVYLKFQGQTIVHNYVQTISFFSFLEIFLKKGLVSGHECNYFKVVEETKNNKRYQSLKCKFIKNEYFIDIPTAKTMLNTYNQTKVGRSFTTVLTSETVLSYSGVVETEGEKVFVASDKDIDQLINHYLNGENDKIVNTQYFSDKISELLDAIKESENEK